MIITDAGRKASGFGFERRDCTVRAFATAFRVSYREAHEHMRSSGRKDRRGFASHGAFRSLSGPSCARTGSVGRFINRNPRGRFVLAILGHVFAVIDGVIYDSHDHRHAARHLKAAWKVTLPELPINYYLTPSESVPK